jgi:hypothetical protein
MPTLRALSTSLVVAVAVACTAGGGNENGRRFEFSDFAGGLFEEPDYRRIYATCAPGRLVVEFDPAGKTEVSYRDGDLVVSLSAEDAEIGCSEAVLDDRREGWHQRGITGATESTKLECQTDRSIDVFVSPLFGRGERKVVGGWMIVSTPVRNLTPRILIASTFDEEDDRSILHYRTGRCRVIGD